jgi:hypothetical protein
MPDMPSTMQASGPGGWVRLSYPDRFSMRPAELEQFCGWMTRQRDGQLQARLVENYRRQPTKLLEPTRLATAASADRPSAYDHVARWPGQDDFAPDVLSMAEAELNRLAELQSREGFWAAFQVDVLTAPDADLAGRLQGWYQQIVERFPASSLWAIDVNRWFTARQSVIRGLFASAEAPEILARPPQQFAGLPAARGLMGVSGLGIAPTVEIALAIVAPWVLGIAANRAAGGIVVVLFGRVEAGRRDSAASELLDLYQPRLLTAAEQRVLAAPSMTAAQAEALLRWWVARLNALFGLALDPASYQDEQGVYHVQRHFGALLSLDRLLACVLGLLVHYRRDEFARKLLLFEALDLLEGLHQPAVEQLCNYTFVDQELKRLEAELPSEVAGLVLPRCRRAAEALRRLQEGFYLHERIESGNIELPRDNGQVQVTALPEAVARYLRVVRNASHTFDEMVRRRPYKISLLAMHDGGLPADLADLAFFHFVRILTDPRSLLPGWLRGRRRQ